MSKQLQNEAFPHEDRNLSARIIVEVFRFEKTIHKRAFIRAWDSAKKTESIWFLEQFSTEALAVLSHEVNRIFLERLESLKQKAGF